MTYTEMTAEIDESGLYRWVLARAWHSDRPLRERKRGTVCFVMVNPSTADDKEDDPTIKKCVGFADAWGFSRLEVRNLYPFRSKNVKDLATAADPEGGMAGVTALMRCEYAALVVCAWGARGKIPKRLRELHLGKVGRFLRAIEIGDKKTKLWCLGVTADGDPLHPLMQPYTARLIPFPPPKEADPCPTATA